MSGIRITKKDLERFTDGDCDILAYELHRLTGWPICTLHCGDRLPAYHAFVLAPKRIAVDVRGARHVTTLVREWQFDFGEEVMGYVRRAWALSDGEVYLGSRRRAKRIAPHLASLVTT